MSTKIFSCLMRITMPAKDKNDFRNTLEKVFLSDYRSLKKSLKLNGTIETGIVFEEAGVKELNTY